MNILDKLRSEGKLGWPIGTRVRFTLDNTSTTREGTIHSIYQDYKHYAIVTDDMVFFQWVAFDEVCKIQTETLNLEIIAAYDLKEKGRIIENKHGNVI